MRSYDEVVSPRGSGGTTAWQQPREAHRVSAADPDHVVVWHVEVFYDGNCPLCNREIRLLRRLDRKKRIRFTNIASADFDARDYGKTSDAFMADIHGRLYDGTWIRGVEVFRRLYAAVGLAPAVWVTRLPGVADLLDWGYHIFARNRLRWTRRSLKNKVSCNDKSCGT